MRYPSLLSLVLLILPFLPLARAWAQAIGDRPVLNVDGNPDYATQDRYDFDDDRTGIRAGWLEVLPSATAAVAYDSNVLATPAPRRQSAVSIGQALLHLTNEPGGVWDFDGEGFARARRFSDASDQNATEYGGSVSVDGGLSARDDLTASVLAQHRFEARTDIETPNIRQISLYDELQGSIGLAHRYNRLQVRYTVAAKQLTYDDASQRYRDRSFYQGLASGSYELGGGSALIATGYYSHDEYRFVTPLVAGGSTAGARVGAHTSIPEIFEFELSAGYFRREFSEHLGEISGLTVVGSAVWYPTRLTTVRADLSREDQPTRIPGAYGKVRTDGLLELGHAYSRNLNIYVRGRVVVDNFETIRRTDTTYLGEIGAFYEISRQLVLGVEYDYSARSSAVTTANFLQHLVSFSLIGRL